MMQTDADAAGVESHALNELEATEGVHEKSLECARGEDMSFATPSEGIIVVANEEHDEPADHTYVVNVADGLPVKCSCPADRNYPSACKHRIACALRPVLLDAAEADHDQGDDQESEIELLADGGVVEEHAPGCDDPGCEGLQADGRPELSFPCWRAWSSEDRDNGLGHTDDPVDIQRERSLIEQQETTPDRDDALAIAVERAFERGI